MYLNGIFVRKACKTRIVVKFSTYPQKGPGGHKTSVMSSSLRERPSIFDGQQISTILWFLCRFASCCSWQMKNWAKSFTKYVMSRNWHKLCYCIQVESAEAQLRSIIKGSPEKSIFATINLVSPVSSAPFLFLHATKTLQHPVFIMCSTICKTVESTKGIRLFAGTFPIFKFYSQTRNIYRGLCCVETSCYHPISTKEICPFSN